MFFYFLDLLSFCYFWIFIFLDFWLFCYSFLGFVLCFCRLVIYVVFHYCTLTIPALADCITKLYFIIVFIQSICMRYFTFILYLFWFIDILMFWMCWMFCILGFWGRLILLGFYFFCFSS